MVSAEGLRIVLEPTVEAAFIHREGLLAHLRDALDAGEVPERDVGVARALLESVSAIGGRGGGERRGKYGGRAPS